VFAHCRSTTDDEDFMPGDKSIDRIRTVTTSTFDRLVQMAVYSLLGLEREPPPVYKGQFNPRVLFEAFVALHEMGA
jgi:myosin-crossreactive antigen